MVTRHQFLAMLHEHLKPRGYLEIGVFSGDSLRLVHRGTPATGIDPHPHLHGHFPGTTRVYQMESDTYFLQAAIPESALSAKYDPVLNNLDLAFIDGMHLFEYALRDFLNIEQYANPRTVVVLDDVLPRNQHEAAREQCPGDWTGDVWKVPKLLESNRPRLHQHWVDTSPTGTYVVYGFEDDRSRDDIYQRIKGLGLENWEVVPDDVINRDLAVSADWAVESIATYLETI